MAENHELELVDVNYKNFDEASAVPQGHDNLTAGTVAQERAFVSIGELA